MTICCETSPAETLHVVRLPGEFGPVLRCLGPLTVITVEALRRELELLMPLRHRALILNLTGCREIDADGVLLLLDTYRRLRRLGKQLVLVAAREPASHLLEVLGIDSFIPVFPTEGAATLALRGGAPPEARTASWEAARVGTLRRWEEVMRCIHAREWTRAEDGMALPQPLCERAVELLQLRRGHTDAHCHLCPLFYALGGRDADLQCRSIRGPLLNALRQHDPVKASRLAREIVETLRSLDDHHL